jgi:hypothetical protein
LSNNIYHVFESVLAACWQIAQKTAKNYEGDSDESVKEFTSSRIVGCLYSSFVLFCSHVLFLSHLVTSHPDVSGTRIVVGELPHPSTIHQVAHRSVFFCSSLYHINTYFLLLLNLFNT